MASKLFRDPLYDYIQIDAKHPWLLDLINTPEMQRLRYISQLGMSHVTYPGSNHSRFSHSLGVLHLMQQCVSHLTLNFGGFFDRLDLEREALLAAALLHDIGHGPFSHATEPIFGSHVRRTVQMIMSERSEVNRVLKKMNTSLPARVAGLIAEKPDDDLEQPEVWQKSLISSQLDVDRLDYLRRDSLCSGAEYGNFDWFRILHTMELNEKEEAPGKQKHVDVTWPKKSAFALEEYVFSRFYMYQSVYYHHTTRGFESLLRTILERARGLAREHEGFVKSLLPPLRTFLAEPDTRDVQLFLDLNDHILIAQITIWQKNSTDSILKDLAGRLLDRRGLGWAEVPHDLSPMEMHEKIDRIQEYLDKQALPHQHYFIEDKTDVRPYKPYTASSSEEQSSANYIILYDPAWLGPNETAFKEITEVPGLERLKAIAGESSAVLRYYFPKEHEQQIKQLLQ